MSTAPAKAPWRPRLLVAGAVLALTATLYVDLREGREGPEVLLSRNFDAQVLDLPAPDFTVQRMDGTQLKLSELRGKVVFVNFWATWCAPCREEFPDLEKMTDALKGLPLEVVAVSGDDNWQDVKRFLGADGSNMTVGIDQSKAISNRYGTEKFPESYVIDRTGRLRLRFISVQPWTDERIQRYLEWLSRQS
ncbi:TlpA family protein disulfide reductase [Myxococcota bacterium]|jgi:peroxiredoxin|nr:TlpA family protein disulfide reductase [Myxococcota bacterium]